MFCTRRTAFRAATPLLAVGLVLAFSVALVSVPTSAGSASTVDTTAEAGLAGLAAANEDEDPDCTDVLHDAFLHDPETVEEGADGSADSTAGNTEVRVEQDAGFVRVIGENPNGYCVEVTVEISAEIVHPAEVGQLEAVDSEHTATWRSTHDFDADETYTEVTFELGAAEKATFAPSKTRVTTLSWTGKAKDEGGGVVNRVQSFFDDDLEERDYILTPDDEATTYITVPLTNESTEQTVDDWQAMYRVDGDDSLKPVGQDPEAAVFYRVVDDGEAVQFVFNDPDAEVEFTANPTYREQASYELRSWISGWEILTGLLMVSGLTASCRQLRGIHP